MNVKVGKKRAIRGRVIELVAEGSLTQQQQVKRKHTPARKPGNGKRTGSK